MELPKHVIDRFNKYIKKNPNGCMEWIGCKNNKGYGKFRLTLKKGDRKTVSSHRFIWELNHGPIKSGMCVLHSCDNPSCVNIGHLFIGTMMDNTRDCMKKGRFKIDQNRRLGSEHGMSKITESDVIKARELYSSGKFTYAKLAKMFGIDKTTVWQLITRATWKHVK